MSVLVRAAKAIAWYVGELMGDHDYARYVEHLKTRHPDVPIPTEKEFWKARWARQGATPEGRCC